MEYIYHGKKLPLVGMSNLIIMLRPNKTSTIYNNQVGNLRAEAS